MLCIPIAGKLNPKLCCTDFLISSASLTELKHTRCCHSHLYSLSRKKVFKGWARSRFEDLAVDRGSRLARPLPFLLDSLLQVASANATSSILVSLKLPACEMGRRHFCNFLGKTKRRRHTSRGICISTGSISETDLLRFGPISVSGWDWWRSVCWLCSWTSASSSGTPSAPSSLLFLSPALWSRTGGPEGPAEKKRRKGVWKLLRWKRKPEVLLQLLWQQEKPQSYHLQPLPELQGNNLVCSNIVSEQEIFPFFKLCAGNVDFSQTLCQRKEMLTCNCFCCLQHCLGCNVTIHTAADHSCI